MVFKRQLGQQFSGFEDRLEEQNVRGLRYFESEARLALERGEVIASIKIIGGKSYIEVDGSNPTKAKAALAALEQAKINSFMSRPDFYNGKISGNLCAEETSA